MYLSYYLQPDYYRTLVEWRTDDPGIGHLDQHYFRMLANKSPIGFGVLKQAHEPFEGIPDIPDDYVTMMRLYRQLASVMQVRTLHEEALLTSG